jgi:uncharacterized protein DUF6636
MARWPIASLASVLAVAVAVSTPADAQTPPIRAFATPSRSVVCVFESPTPVAGTGVACVVPAVRTHRTLPFDHDVWTYYSVHPQGTATQVLSDASSTATRARRMPHGATWAMGTRGVVRRRRAGAVNCTCRPTGMTCRNAAGHGFTLSRRQSRVF